jgi:hypothetical protein
MRFASTVVLLTFACTFSACQLRRGNTVLIPDGYIGWVRIYYNVPSGARLPLVNGKYLLTVNSEGIVRTSDALDYGYGADEYYYVRRGGNRAPLEQEGVERRPTAMIHSHFSITDKYPVHMFFVGPKSALDKFPRPEE